MKRHMRLVHGPRTFKCRKCGYDTFDQKFFNRHMAEKHQIFYDRQCELCDFVTAKRSYMGKHVRRVHSGMNKLVGHEQKVGHEQLMEPSSEPVPVPSIVSSDGSRPLGMGSILVVP